MREIDAQLLTKNIKEMCIEANHYLSDDMKKVFDNARNNEKSPLGKQILEQLDENLKIARERYDTNLSGHRDGSRIC